MADKQSITRIVDLPENITMQISNPAQQQQYMQQPLNTRQPLDMNSGEHNLNYNQMNVHPNPYGNPMQPNGLPLPQSTQIPSQNGFLSQQNVPQYRLPSRDIPRDTDGYTQDIETTANYIPSPKLTSDYIRDFQKEEEVAIKTHKEKKHRERLIDTLLTEIQIPIFIGILFFVFQMPLVDTLIFKRMSFMRIYNEDGNFNFYGLFVKSIMFGCSFYSLTRVLEYISSL